MNRPILILFTFLAVMFTSCSSEVNNEEDNEVDKVLPQNIKDEITFNVNKDGSVVYTGKTLTLDEMEQHVYGHGWKSIASYRIDENGKLYKESTKDYEAHEMFYFDHQGSTMTEYNQNGGYSSYKSKFEYRGEYSLEHAITGQVFSKTFLKYDPYGGGRLFTLDYPLMETTGKSIPVVNVFGMVDDKTMDELLKKTNFNGSLDKAPDNCKFKLMLDGESAPFKLLHFQLANNKGEVDSHNPAFEYFDSIVFVKTIGKGINASKSYYKVSSKDDSGLHTTYEWSTYLYDNDKVTLTAEGWKNNQVVYEQSMDLDLSKHALGIFGYFWRNGAVKYDTPIGIYNIFDKDDTFTLIPPTKSADGHLYLQLYCSDERLSPEQKLDRLEELINSLYGSHMTKIDSDEKVAKVRAYFHCLPKDVTPVRYWTLPETHVVIVVKKADDITLTDRYFIHAEPED